MCVVEALFTKTCHNRHKHRYKINFYVRRRRETIPSPKSDTKFWNLLQIRQYYQKKKTVIFKKVLFY